MGQYLAETIGHLPETEMETETTFRLVIPQIIFLENPTKKRVVGHFGEIQQVRQVIAVYLLIWIITLIKMGGKDFMGLPRDQVYLVIALIR